MPEVATEDVTARHFLPLRSERPDLSDDDYAALGRAHCAWCGRHRDDHAYDEIHRVVCPPSKAHLSWAEHRMDGPDGKPMRTNVELADDLKFAIQAGQLENARRAVVTLLVRIDETLAVRRRNAI